MIGKRDWTIGPKHYQGVDFPNMIRYKSAGGHLPFIENKKDVRKAIDRFLRRFDL